MSESADLFARLRAVAAAADRVGGDTQREVIAVLSRALASEALRDLGDGNPQPSLEAAGSPAFPRVPAKPSTTDRGHPQVALDPGQEVDP